MAFAFVDFRKAFDSVSHPVLLEKLSKNFGICHQALGWIAGYLNGRNQYTVVNGNITLTHSCIRRHTTGIGARPYTVIFIYQRFTVKCEIRLPYLVADDTTIYCIKRTADEAVAQLDKAVDELCD